MWNDLSIAQKSELMKMFIQNGVYDLNTIIKEYDSRHQSGDEATLPNYSQNVYQHGGSIKEDSILGNRKPNANFYQRLLDANRKTIPDWKNPEKAATHKMSWSTDDRGNAIVYPDVQEINGELHDFTDPKYNHSEWDSFDRAMEVGDTIMMTPKQAKYWTKNYKKYYPKFDNYANGGHLFAFGTPDWDPDHPYHYHTDKGEKVVITPEDWEANKGKSYFKEVEDAVNAERAAYPGPEYEVDQNYVNRLNRAYGSRIGSTNGAYNFRGYASQLPEGYTISDQGVIYDNEGNAYVQDWFTHRDYPYDVNSPITFTFNKGKGSERKEEFYPVNMQKRVKDPFPVDRIMNVEQEKTKAIEKYIADNSNSEPIYYFDIFRNPSDILKNARDKVLGFDFAVNHNSSEIYTEMVRRGLISDYKEIPHPNLKKAYNPLVGVTKKQIEKYHLQENIKNAKEQQAHVNDENIIPLYRGETTYLEDTRKTQPSRKEAEKNAVIPINYATGGHLYQGYSEPTQKMHTLYDEASDQIYGVLPELTVSAKAPKGYTGYPKVFEKEYSDNGGIYGGFRNKDKAYKEWQTTQKYFSPENLDKYRGKGFKPFVPLVAGSIAAPAVVSAGAALAPIVAESAPIVGGYATKFGLPLATAITGGKTLDDFIARNGDYRGFADWANQTLYRENATPENEEVLEFFNPGYAVAGIPNTAIKGIKAINKAVESTAFGRNARITSELNKAIRNTKLSGDINIGNRTLNKNTRFRLGDVEIDDPNLMYRQTDSRALGEVASGGNRHTMFNRGSLWYGIPTESMLNPVIEPKTVDKLKLTKPNSEVAKTHLLVTRNADMTGANQKFGRVSIGPHSESSLHLNIEKSPEDRWLNEMIREWRNKNSEPGPGVATYVTDGGSRRVPLEGALNNSNTSIYTFDSGYGYRRIGNEIPTLEQAYQEARNARIEKPWSISDVIGAENASTNLGTNNKAYSISLEDALNNPNFNWDNIGNKSWFEIMHRVKPNVAEKNFYNALNNHQTILSTEELNEASRIINSDWYKKRLENAGLDAEVEISKMNERLNRTKVYGYDNIKTKDFDADGLAEIAGVDNIGNKYSVKLKNSLMNDERKKVATHEGLHITSGIGTEIPLQEPLIQNWSRDINPKLYDYMNIPDEQRVRFLKLADYIERSGGDYEGIISKEYNNRHPLTEKDRDFTDLFRSFNLNDVINRAKVQYVLPYTVGVGGIAGYSALNNNFQSGGQLGHITPYGQWQYPHQVTTIPSNNITMQGVSYPVIGVSDTGDTKVMLPGLDYLYDGNYVTEYPV